jgi:hypothetical protein
MIDIVLDPNTQEIQASESGDFLVDDTSNNTILYLVVSNPGDWKQFPLVGVGIFGFLQAITSPAQIEQAILKQLKADIFPNPTVNAKGFPTIIVNGTQIKIA